MVATVVDVVVSVVVVDSAEVSGVLAQDAAISATNTAMLAFSAIFLMSYSSPVYCLTWSDMGL